MKKVVVIGGGTGTFIVLSGLKNYPINLSVIVSMMDSGGSTGRLRDQLGVLPPGDLRQCLVALSEASIVWRKLFLYRFEKGDLKGHNFGNIFLSVLEKITNNYQEVVQLASLILKVKGEIIPVTFQKTELGLEYHDGKRIVGEDKIEKLGYTNSQVKRAFLFPKSFANPRAVLAIKNADYLVIGPGDLYTSLIVNLLFEKIQKAIIQSKAKIIYVMNLMTKKGQTTNYSASSHIKDLEKYLGRKIDFVLINNQTIPSSIIRFYQKYGEKPVVDDLGKHPFVIRLPLLAKERYNKSKSDELFRSVLRHDSEKLAKAIFKIISYL